MNYLELTQKAIRQSGARIDAPSTVSGLDGLQELFAEFVSAAWRDLQLERPEWQFRQGETYYNLDPETIRDGIIIPPAAIQSEFQQNWRLIALRDVFIADAGTAPEITSSNTAGFTSGTPETRTFTATGDPDPTFYLSGDLPAGITFNQDAGTISGTATETGEYVLTLYASNGVGPDAEQEFTLTVTMGGDTP